jgi:dolichol-phosphate mannosyltransferase
MSLLRSEVACIIPTLNEDATIADVIQQSRHHTKRIIVVDGHSTDETRQIAIDTGATVLLERQRGKGIALRSAFNTVTAKVYITIDGDGTYDGHEMKNLLAPLQAGQADMVVGSRFLGKMERGAISPLNTFGNHLFNFLVNRLTGSKMTDSQSGYRAISQRALTHIDLSSVGFEIETELTMKILRAGFRVIEVPITYRKRRGTPPKLRAIRDGIKIITTILVNIL